MKLHVGDVISLLSRRENKIMRNDSLILFEKYKDKLLQVRRKNIEWALRLKKYWERRGIFRDNNNMRSKK